jgi:hypothetical protein
MLGAATLDLDDGGGWEPNGDGLDWLDPWGDRWIAIGRPQGGHDAELRALAGSCARCGCLAVRGESLSHHLEGEFAEGRLAPTSAIVYVCEAWSRRRASPGLRQIPFSAVPAVIARVRALPWVQALRRCGQSEWVWNEPPELRLVDLPPLPPGFQSRGVTAGLGDSDRISLTEPILYLSLIHEITHWIIGTSHRADWVGVNLALNEALGHHAYADRLRGAVCRYLGRPPTLTELLAGLHGPDGYDGPLPLSYLHSVGARPGSPPPVRGGIGWWQDPERAAVLDRPARSPDGPERPLIGAPRPWLPIALRPHPAEGS